jgi:hypothetical protein
VEEHERYPRHDRQAHDPEVRLWCGIKHSTVLVPDRIAIGMQIQKRTRDNVLALLLCMLTNITSIDNNPRVHSSSAHPSFRETLEVFNEPWKGADHSFTNLQKLKYAGYEARIGSHPFLPTMEMVELCHTSRFNPARSGGIFIDEPIKPALSVFRRLVFLKVKDMDLHVITRLLRERALINLEGLTLA